MLIDFLVTFIFVIELLFNRFCIFDTVNTLRFHKTKLTPEIICDPKGEIIISGRSLPENALEIFDPLFLWIDEYVKNAPDKTIINCELEYVNSSSNRHIHTAFKKFEPLIDAGKTVEVNWTYEEGDEDTYDLGADYNDFLKVTFNFIEK